MEAIEIRGVSTVHPVLTRARSSTPPWRPCPAPMSPSWRRRPAHHIGSARGICFRRLVFRHIHLADQGARSCRRSGRPSPIERPGKCTTCTCPHHDANGEAMTTYGRLRPRRRGSTFEEIARRADRRCGHQHRGPDRHGPAAVPTARPRRAGRGHQLDGLHRPVRRLRPDRNSAVRRPRVLRERRHVRLRRPDQGHGLAWTAPWTSSPGCPTSSMVCVPGLVDAASSRTR